MPEQPNAPQGAALIPLRTRAGQVRAWTTIDETDHPWLSQWRWCLQAQGYAMRAESTLVTGSSTFRGVLMHRAILGLEHGDPRQADHINGDRLDNRRMNLRIVTVAQNNQNLPAKGGYSQHRGVTWVRKTGKWTAQVMVGYRNHNLGSFETEQEAARAAAEFRRTHMPYSRESR
jgi:hypothetical protein